MSDNGFVEKVNVENPSTGNSPISDYEFIHQYQKNVPYYMGDPGQTYLKECMRYYKPNDNTYDLDSAHLTMEWALKFIPHEIKDEKYKEMITALKEDYTAYLSICKRFPFAKKQSEIETYKAARKKLYDSICALVDFHEQRRTQYKQALIRQDYMAEASKIKRIFAQLPDHVPSGVSDKEYESFALATSSLKELPKHLGPAKTVIDICSRNK